MDPAYLKMNQDGYAFLGPLLWFDNINYGRLDTKAANILRLADNGISLIAGILVEIVLLQDLAEHNASTAEEMLNGVQEKTLEDIKDLCRIHNELCIHQRPLDDIYALSCQGAAEVFRQFGSSFHNAAFNAINRFLAFMFDNSWDPETQVDLLILKNWQFSENELRFSDLTIFPAETFSGPFGKYYIALESLNRSNEQCRAELHREAYKVTKLIASAGIVEDCIGNYNEGDNDSGVDTPGEIILREGTTRYVPPKCAKCGTKMRVLKTPATTRLLKCPNCKTLKTVVRI